MGIADYSATPANNTTVGGANIAENCDPGEVNNAIRQIMADVRSWADNTAVNVQFFGATGDGVTDDTTAIQDAADYRDANNIGAIWFPPGTYKTTSPISIAALSQGIKIYGAGVETTIKPVGVSAFSFPGNGYYRSSLSDMKIVGTAAAGVAAIDTSPTTVTFVHAGMDYYNINIQNFVYGWKLKNAQLVYFHDFDIDLPSGGAVFQITPDSGSGQQCNANRVHRMRVTGSGQVAETTLPTGTERATDWLFKECDVQLAGTAIPFHVIDSMWAIEDCEFENSTAAHLIHLEATGASLAPFNARIIGNNFIGGTVPIRSSKAAGASQTPNYVNIANNKRGSGVLLDGEAGLFFTIENNEGTINDTGLRFTTRINGRGNEGVFRAVNGPGGNDAVGALVGAISSSGTLGKNLAGQVTFASTGTASVAFAAARAEPDASYRVAVTGNVNETFWVTGKATTGFTINSSNATSTATVDWIIIR